MQWYDLVLTAFGLAMDAFAVAVCKGLSMDRVRLKHYLIVGLWFGGFQALMPLGGFWLGEAFGRYIQTVDHWIAFGLLVLIGGNMIRESFGTEECDAGKEASLAIRVMLPMAVATSIDAMAVGVAFAVLPDVRIFSAVVLIGLITFAMSAVGVKIGNVFGCRWKAGAERLGGVILVLMGTKILLEHLGVLG